MTWEENLRATARDLGRGLERAHPNPPARRRIRVLPIAVAVIAVAAVFAFRPRDPAAAIENAYAGQFSVVRIDDPELRREFEAALAQIDRAIALAKDAVRRSPGDPAFAELCHLAFQAKVRLIQAYTGGS